MALEHSAALRTAGIAVLVALVTVGGAPIAAAAEAPRAKVAGSVWDRLAWCESTGNWSIDTGNGYYGGLQFSLPTWRDYGGPEYASYPHRASKAQQIDVATKVRDDRGGFSAWPACASTLGLPT